MALSFHLGLADRLIQSYRADVDCKFYQTQWEDQLAIIDRSLSPIIFAANFNAAKDVTRKAYELRTNDLGFKEDWLQKAIAENPELVIAPCREGGLTVRQSGERDERWMLWDREVSVRAPKRTGEEEIGAIDVLLLSKSGRIGIVETKLSYNPGKRREVVAQVLEYAFSLPSVSLSKLPEIPRGADGKPFANPEDVQSGIQEGDYLCIIAGDRLDPRAVRLGEALLGRHLARAWDLALVEVAIFEQTGGSGNSDCLVVPHLRGATIAEQRQVVRVEIEGDRTRVAVEATAPVRMGQHKWDEERFFAEADQTVAPLREFASKLRQLKNTYYAGVTFDFGKGATPTVMLRKGEQTIVGFTLPGPVYSTGYVWFYRPKESLPRALGEECGAYYLGSLERLFPAAMTMEAPAVKLAPETAERDLRALLALLEEVLTRSAEQTRFQAAASS